MKFTLLLSALALAAGSFAQVTGSNERNTSKKANDDNECAVAVNPKDRNQVFISANTSTAGLFAARSLDGGLTWTYPDPSDKTIADGDAGQGAAACCDPTLAWDSFGNLYVTYINSAATAIVTLRSTDAGLTFTQIGSFTGSVDQPTVVVADTSQAGAPVALWVVWNSGGSMVARGAAVTGLGSTVTFNAQQAIPGTSGYSFGDVAIAPNGAVVNVAQTSSGQGPSPIIVNTDADGLGPGNFGAAVTVTQTNVGGFDFITPQNTRSVDAETGLAFDAYPASPHFGRLYLVYTDEVVNENNDTDIRLRWSDNNGATWSNFIRVNDDATTRSQFLPKIASNPASGNIAVCWHDCRNSSTNRAAELWATVATPAGSTPVFLANAKVSGGASTSNNSGVEFGDYLGLGYSNGWIFPGWADTSNSTGDNPNGTTRFEANSVRVSGGASANEGIVVDTAATAYTLARGQSLSGTVANTATSDNSYLVLSRGPTVAAESPLDATFVTALPQSTVNSVTWTFEAKASVAGWNQKVYAFNYFTSAWDLIDTRATSLADQVFSVTVTTTAGNYIHAGDKEAKLRVTYDPVGAQNGKAFTASIDHVRFRSVIP